jgi:hypothetical protein
MVVSSAKKKTKTLTTTTNVKRELRTEFQASIAYACFDSPSLLCGASTLTDVQQMKKMSELYLGDCDDDADIVCCVDQFLHGLDRFHGLYSESAVDVQPGVSPNAAMLLTLLPVFHQRGLGVNIFVGDGSIERSFLVVGKTKPTVLPISGRTLLRVAKEVLRSCKKMTAIVTASNSPYKDGNFPSGTNWDDYIRWCITAMKKCVAAEKAGMIIESPLLQKELAEKAIMAAENSPDDVGLATDNDKLLNEERADDVTDVGLEFMVDAPTVEDATNVSTELVVDVPTGEDDADGPDGTFFKGFVAWCLWGHIPITIDPEMKSMAFTDSKVGTSYGRKKGSRQAMKDESSLLSSIDNRRGKKRGFHNDQGKADNDAITLCSGGADDNNTAMTSFVGGTVEDDGILKQALEYLDSESLEKARQKHSMLSCLRVRDEISSLRGQVESVSRRYYHATTGTSVLADSLLEKMEALEAKLLEREEYLSFLQNEEANRQLNVISERAAIRAAASLADDRSRQQSSIRGDKRLVVEPTATTTPINLLTPVKRPSPILPSGVVMFESPMNSPAEAMLSIACAAVLVCFECSITPTTHKCRRCARYVCDLCCYSNRRLEMVWWCGECFDKESVTNQNTIRDGNYESDGESNYV